MKRKIYLIIGITAFILILTSSNMLLNVPSSSGDDNNKAVISKGENITHTGKFLIPVENYIKMTCKYRTENTSNNKKTIISYWCGFSRD